MIEKGKTVRTPIPDADEEKEVKENLEIESKKRKVKKIRQQPQQSQQHTSAPAPRNKKYYEAWVDYFKHFEVPEYCRTLATHIDCIEFTAEGPRAKKNVNRDKFIKNLKFMGRKKRAFVYENVDLPENFDVTDKTLSIMGIMSSKFEENLEDVRANINDKNLGNYTFYISKPHMLAKWMTDESAEVYLAILDTIEDSDYFKGFNDLELVWDDDSREYDTSKLKEFKKIARKIKSPDIIGEFMNKYDHTKTFLKEYTALLNSIIELFEINHNNMTNSRPHRSSGLYCSACKKIDNIYEEK